MKQKHFYITVFLVITITISTPTFNSEQFLRGYTARVPLKVTIYNNSGKAISPALSIPFGTGGTGSEKRREESFIPNILINQTVTATGMVRKGGSQIMPLINTIGRRYLVTDDDLSHGEIHLVFNDDGFIKKQYVLPSTPAAAAHSLHPEETKEKKEAPAAPNTTPSQ